MQAPKLRLFGYSCRQVEECIRELGLQHENELAGLRQRLESARRVTEELSEELAALRSRWQERTARAEVLRLARERLDRVAALLAEAAREESQAILQDNQTRLAAYEAERIRVEQEIEKVRTRIRAIMRNVLRVLDEQADKGEGGAAKVAGAILPRHNKSDGLTSVLGINFLQAGPNCREIANMAVITVDGTTLGRVTRPGLDRTGKEVTGFYYRENPQGPERFIPVEKVLVVKNEAIVVEAGYAKEALPPQPGPRLNGECKGEFSSAGGHEHATEGGAAATAEELRNVVAQEGGFWGPVGAAWEEMAALSGTGAVVRSRDEPDRRGGAAAGLAPPARKARRGEERGAAAFAGKVESGPGREGGYWPPAEPAEALDELGDSGFAFFLPATTPAQEAAAKEGHGHAAAEAAPAEAAFGGSAPTAESSNVREDAEALSYKYLVGKLAGRDLTDDEGRLIVAKHAPITPAIVEAARKEGKLAELIVYMVSPDLVEGED